MFTGIVESTGTITEITTSGTNRTFWISSPLSSGFRVDQSVAHSGVCLTVEDIISDKHRVTAIAETLEKTDLGNWQVGSIVNLERSLMVNSRLDGHFVQGHVDTVASCTKRKDREGSWEFTFHFPKKFGALVIEKGSICVNGVSLTAFNVEKNSFRVAIIPYTFEHTNLNGVDEGSQVNIEFDMIGKYILRNKEL